MPDLVHSLQPRDLGHLRIVALLWGVELSAAETDAARKELATALLDLELVREEIDALPTDARSALEALAAEEGRIPWAAFARRFGEIREAGPGRRDREQVYLSPVSAAEVLFYRALLAKAFFDTPNGPQEFAYIPEDLLSLIHRAEREGGGEKKKEVSLTVAKFNGEPLGRPASPKERAYAIPASDRILDDACTLLAALRLGWKRPPHLIDWRYDTKILLELLKEAKLVGDSTPQPEPVKNFLETRRDEALGILAEAWRASEVFNELRQLPGLVFEGEWKNEPFVTRRFLLDLLSAIPKGQWWSLSAFVHAVKEKCPDFQRPAGDYDSWFVKRESDGTYLRGFEAWDEVDGALARYFITGPLHWSGLADLASPEGAAAPTAFRMTNPKTQLSGIENGKLHTTSQGKVVVPRLLSRAVRYQIARFCDWEDEKADEYRYRVTTESLKRANKQGLKVEQLLGLLRKHAAAPLPPPFVRALQRWELNGTEARVENPVVLRVSRPEVLEELRKSKAGRFLGESLGPTAVVVKPGAQSKVLAALAELGLLAEVVTKGDIIAGETTR
jgi:hypothetical protein